MSFVCQYIAVDDETLDYLADMPNGALLQMLDELSADSEVPRYEMGPLWDGLHFLLTAAPAACAIEDDPLSEAVVGVHVFNDDDEDADFVGCTENDDLTAIIGALDKLDKTRLEAEFNPSDFRKAGIKPDIWNDVDSVGLFSGLMKELGSLREFYGAAEEGGWHIVIYIK